MWQICGSLPLLVLPCLSFPLTALSSVIFFIKFFFFNFSLVCFLVWLDFKYEMAKKDMTNQSWEWLYFLTNFKALSFFFAGLGFCPAVVHSQACLPKIFPLFNSSLTNLWWEAFFLFSLSFSGYCISTPYSFRLEILFSLRFFLIRQPIYYYYIPSRDGLSFRLYTMIRYIFWVKFYCLIYVYK